MARVHHVKKARKANKAHGIKKGQEYWWVQPNRWSGKRIFTRPPRPSETTGSEYYGTLWEIQERMADAMKGPPLAQRGEVQQPDKRPKTFEELRTMVEEWVGDLEQLKDDTQDKFDNMPEGLQSGDTGQTLEQRVSDLEEYIGELQGIEVGPVPVSDQVQILLEEITDVTCNDS